ncbi:MAG: choice-of-anchor D domain-containing protein, partial [Candidatus Acidiferrum sp.]
LLGISGCTGMVNAQPKVGQSAVQVTPASLDFGTTGVGKKVSHPASVTNTTTEVVTLTDASVSSNEFTVAGLQFPLSIQPGQKANFTVWFKGSKAGKTTATFNFHGSHGSTDPVVVTGTAGSTDPQLSVSAASHDFGSVTVNTVATTPITLTNSGASTLKISGVTVTGAAFASSSLKPPAKISAGQSVLLNVTFSPKAAGTFPGRVSIASNDPDNPTTNVDLTGVATAEAVGRLTATPAVLILGTVKVGGSTSAVTALKNAGTANVTLSKIDLSGAGFSTTGIVTPVVIVPGESLTLSVKFSPTAAGTKTGTILLTSSQGAVTTVSVSGTATAVPATATPELTVSPGSINFGNVVAGVTNTQTVQLANPGTVSVTVSAANMTGAGFATSGLNLPLTLNAGQTSTFNVQFNPKAAGASTGNLSLSSDATSAASSISLSGMGVAAGLTLSVNPSSVSFGSVTVGSSSSRSITVSNTGNSNVSISAVNVSGSQLTLSGGSAVTLSPSQSINLTVQFSPTSAASTSGSVSIVSNATGSPAAVSVSGTGVAQVQHVVGLSWNASPAAAGYNVYRSLSSGSAYLRLNSGLDAQLIYSDNSVQGSQTYFYVTTAVASDGTESAYSTEVSV